MLIPILSFTVTAIFPSVTSFIVLTIFPMSLGEDMRDAPLPVFITFFTGQAALMSMSGTVSRLRSTSVAFSKDSGFDPKSSTVNGIESGFYGGNFNE